jgi:mono/diheme cytochrome c family protein
LKILRKMFVALVILLFVVAAVAPQSFAGKKGDPKAGQKTYDTFCTACHGTSGRGDGPAAVALPVKPKNLADGKYLKTLTDEYLFKVIKEGGVSVGKSGLMAPWGGQIDEQGIRNVVAYIRSLAKSGK